MDMQRITKKLVKDFGWYWIRSILLGREENRIHILSDGEMLLSTGNNGIAVSTHRCVQPFTISSDGFGIIIKNCQEEFRGCTIEESKTVIEFFKVCGVDFTTDFTDAIGVVEKMVEKISAEAECLQKALNSCYQMRTFILEQTERNEK